MAQAPKLTERITRLEEAILEIKTILEQKDNITDLIAQLKRSKTVSAPTPAPEPVALAPAQVIPDPVPVPVAAPDPTPAPVAAPDPTPAPLAAPATGTVSESFIQQPVEEVFVPPALPAKPSLTMVLTSLSPTSVKNESKLVKKYLEHVDAFLEDHPSDEGVSVDYRVLAVTLEFVSVAEKELKYLTNTQDATRGMCVQATIWLLNAYKDHNAAVQFAFPPNLELLIATVYDIVLFKYMVKAPEEIAVQAPKKASKWALYWSTFKKRWSHAKEPSKQA
jgi:hypothetical protein